MNRNDVNRVIRREVRPFLKKHGFSRFTGAKSWRFHQDSIDIVNFQSFNSYNADTIGCTTYSFSVNLGWFPLYIPDLSPTVHKKKDDLLFPEEYGCNFRRSLRRSFVQQELEWRHIWYVDPEGRYLDKSVHDARMALARDGLDWFERFADRDEVLRILLEDEEEIDGGTWGFGRPTSPLRSYLLGYAALALGHQDLAREHLLAAAATDSYCEFADRLTRDAEQ